MDRALEICLFNRRFSVAQAAWKVIRFGKTWLGNENNYEESGNADKETQSNRTTEENGLFSPSGEEWYIFIRIWGIKVLKIVLWL